MQIKVQVNKYVCERCGHIWIGRTMTIPKFCPKCKTLYWNIPRKSKNKQNDK